MTDWLLAHEPVLRLTAFGSTFAAMALWELLGERRRRGQPRAARWVANLGILMVDALIIRLLFPAAAVGFALLVESKGWGALPRLGLPQWLGVGLSIVWLDLGIYLQHVLFHAVPVLWRLHRVHHSDRDLDLTTGLRFHPFEIVLSMVLKGALIAVVGTPPVAVFLFEVILNATSIFNHSNVRVPAAAERWVRLFLVTPDMHRVHHSVLADESRSNFGFNLPWWDRLFGTFRAQPRDGHLDMALGLEEAQEGRPRSLFRLLALPFVELPPSKPQAPPKPPSEPPTTTP